jgi:hypothetical protein
MTAFSHFSPK